MAYTGRCCCGEVRYELDALRIVSGEEQVAEYHHAGGYRAFCRRCGTRLWNGLETGPPFPTLVVASLDREPEHGPVMHIDLESKAGGR